ncbi:MAG: TonB-dependent receptor [Gammaproteobacteria bacterium]|nr:TonB-dependent receptor [Gammaproteobacteria bacterium]
MRRAAPSGWALASLVFFSSGACAVDELVVTGTRLAVAPGDLPGALTVIGRDDIEARADAGFVDLLRAVPGIHVVQPGAGGVTQLFLRGAEPNYTLFLIDGIEVNDPTNTRGGSFDLAAIGLADVERVEIVRGPQSSIYGADALAGVVNVVGRTGGGEPVATVEAEAGSEELARGSLAVAGALGTGGYALAFSRRDDGEAVPGSHYEADTVLGRLRLAPADGLEVGAVARYAGTERSSFPEESGGPQHAQWRGLDTGEAHELGLGGDFDWTLAPQLAVQGTLSRYERRDRYDSPGIAPGDRVPPNGARNDLERSKAALRLTSDGGGRWSATAGVDFQRESGESAGYVDFAPDLRLANDFSLDRNTTGVFAEGRVQATDGLWLQASLRRDEPQGASAETTGRVGAVFALAGGATRLHANWGTGFRLPSFFALGSPLVGNPQLRPEQSESVELGIGQRLGGSLDLAMTVFAVDYEDFIDFDEQSFRNVNRDRVTSRGVELAAAWTPGPTLALRGHATHVDLDVVGEERQLLQRPDWRAGAGLRWTPQAAWQLDLDWLWVGETLDHALPTGTLALDAYHRVDLALGWQATPRLRVTFAIDNLFDADYEEAIGFPAPGLRSRASVRYRFGG